VKSSALLFGEAVSTAVGLFLMGMVLCLITAGQLSGLRMGYYLILALLAGLFIWQIRRLQTPVTPQVAFLMFQQHVYAGATILAGIWIGTFDRTP
jgi:4-hydroxybenzoate polyprenyltransferase